VVNLHAGSFHGGCHSSVALVLSIVIMWAKRLTTGLDACVIASFADHTALSMYSCVPLSMSAPRRLDQAARVIKAAGGKAPIFATAPMEIVWFPCDKTISRRIYDSCQRARFNSPNRPIEPGEKRGICRRISEK
jgi:hypothetical protein